MSRHILGYHLYDYPNLTELRLKKRNPEIVGHIYPRNCDTCQEGWRKSMFIVQKTGLAWCLKCGEIDDD